MSILDKMGYIEKLDEGSGIRNIKALAKEYKKATGYFHMDTDGVCSAIAMKAYLEDYGIKTVKAYTIQYGGSEFAAKKPEKGTLVWLVDFAHGKPFVNIHTDHHDGQIGVQKKTSTSFHQTPSNATYISSEISPRDLFPMEDLKLINIVDSADFAKNNIPPEKVMNAAFGYDSTIDVSKNREAMGLVVNKLLLTYKNKPDFLSDLVMQSKPSLVSMYIVIKRLAKANGYKTPAEIGEYMGDYVTTQASKYQGENVDIKSLTNGGNTFWGTCLVQYGGGSMFKAYDRYTPFKNHPDADYMCIGWPMGLVQLSKNPFSTGKNPYHLGDLVQKEILVPKYKAKWEKIFLNLYNIKRTFEMDIKGYDSIGFGFDDFVAAFNKDIIKGMKKYTDTGETSDYFSEMVHKFTNMKLRDLSPKQADILRKVEISYWDLIQSGSGGHPSITNISNLNFYGKGYPDAIIKPLMQDIAELMADKKLQK